MKKIHRIMSLAMSALLAMSAISCMDSLTKPTVTKEASEATETITEAVFEPVYVYPSVDYKDYTFKILNYAEQYGCYVKLNLDEMTGETVDDAIYTRNNLVEDKYLRYRWTHLRSDCNAYRCWK
jgi:hypothetical protein